MSPTTIQTLGGVERGKESRRRDGKKRWEERRETMVGKQLLECALLSDTFHLLVVHNYTPNIPVLPSPSDHTHNTQHMTGWFFLPVLASPSGPVGPLPSRPSSHAV